MASRPLLSSERSDGRQLGARLRAGDLGAAPAVLNLVESASAWAREQTLALVSAVSPAALGAEAGAHIVGVTGPPGVGKSSLLSRLVAAWRARGRTVAVLAVDPSSRRSGGALLGDRARIEVDPGDRGVFVRSTATANRLGGLAPGTRAAAVALAAAFDVVVVETVGVGQSEIDVAEVADTVAVVLQPGAGDVLQFIKAGLMEVPDVLVVTKADLGQAAMRTRADLEAALVALRATDTPVVAVSALAPASGIDELARALAAHRAGLDLAARRLHARRMHALADFAAEYGERGVRALGGRRAASRWLTDQPAALDAGALTSALAKRARVDDVDRDMRG